MVAAHWPPTCVFNELYLEKLPVFYATFFNNCILLSQQFLTRIAMGHDLSAVPILADRDRGPMCGEASIKMKS